MRRFANKTIEELEGMFQKEYGDADFRRELGKELSRRKIPKAQKLAIRLRNFEESASKSNRVNFTTKEKTIPSDLQKVASPAPPHVIIDECIHTEPFIPNITETPHDNAGSARRYSDSPEESVLNAWIAMEVLSPSTFNRPEALVGGKRENVAWFKNGQLPWEYGHKRFMKGCATYYQVVLGSIQMAPAIDMLLGTYSDPRAQRPQAKGEAVLACILVDKDGIPAETDPVTISSFGWGVPVALAGDLKALGLWAAAEKLLVKQLADVIIDKDEDGNPIRAALTSQRVSEAYHRLVAKLGIPEKLLTPPSFATVTFQSYRTQANPETLLLNSFFIKDLALIKRQAAAGKLPDIMKRYLGTLVPDSHRNLLDDTEALRETLAPARFPSSSWPGKGRHPLVLLQQCAVNTAISDTGPGEMLAVNGPPGTGKTTLLRDIIAGILTKRAEAMLQFDDPEKAFIHSGEKVKRGGNAFLHLYHLDKRLRGFEVVVASSNNKAVENVSVELPGRGAVDDDCFPGGYFSSVSRTIWPEQDTWGMISAVLGNAKNRSAFRQAFWWDEQYGMHHYLKHACGTPVFVADDDGNQCTPAIIREENPPADHTHSLIQWNKARTRFKQALKASRERLAYFQKAHDLDVRIMSEEKKVEEVALLLLSLDEQLEPVENSYQRILDEVTEKRSVFALFEMELAEIRHTRPGFFARFFNTALHQTWKARHDTAMQRQLNARTALAAAEKSHNEIAGIRDTLLVEKQRLETERRRLTVALSENKRQYEGMKFRSTGAFIDREFFAKEHTDRQASAPWLDQETTISRGAVFETAVALHKAFIDAAAKPIRHNLGVFLENFGMKTLGKPERDNLVPDLWSTFFLLVPVVSTTFASAGAMFAGLGSEQLGWLLVDEAGQALPQAAAGSIYRSRRAVVVGDPLQIEPIVTLPETLTERICETFGVNPNLYNPPGASVQTLADRATKYAGSFETKQGTREVGVPLLVHRRCENPMFRISNAAAYEHLMVQQKAGRASPIRECLGASSWIHVPGNGGGKWNPEEGGTVIGMLNTLKAKACIPDLYIVTPFVDVQNALRELVEKTGIFSGWVAEPHDWVNERIGTVHTVQGREAEAVFFVLGAPGMAQAGARIWAGKTPNLVNVAVTRAKEALYVIGDESAWRTAGVFSILHEELCRRQL